MRALWFRLQLDGEERVFGKQRCALSLKLEPSLRDAAAKPLNLDEQVTLCRI